MRGDKQSLGLFTVFKSIYYGTFAHVQGPGFLQQQGWEGQLPPDLIWKALGNRWSHPPLTRPWKVCGKDTYPHSATVKLHLHTSCSTELTTLSETLLVGPPPAHLLLEAVLYQNVLSKHDLWNGARKGLRAEAEDADDVF